MTRKKAAIILENDIINGHVEGNADFMDAFWMAVDALKAIDKITEWINTPNRGNADYFIVDKIEEIIREV